MVAAEDCNALRVADFESDKERYSLHREVAAIDVVAFTGQKSLVSVYQGCSPMKR